MHRALPFALAFMLVAPVVAHADGESLVDNIATDQPYAGQSECDAIAAMGGGFDENTGKVASRTPFHRRAFMVCNAGSCATADLGGPYTRCTASLSNDGILTHACDEDTVLGLEP